MRSRWLPFGLPEPSPTSTVEVVSPKPTPPPPRSLPNLEDILSEAALVEVSQPLEAVQSGCRRACGPTKPCRTGRCRRGWRASRPVDRGAHRPERGVTATLGVSGENQLPGSTRTGPRWAATYCDVGSSIRKRFQLGSLPRGNRSARSSGPTSSSARRRSPRPTSRRRPADPVRRHRR